jgi:hypothetical protein
MQDVSSRALRFNITHKRREMQLVEMQVVVVEDVEEEALEEVVVVDGVVVLTNNVSTASLLLQFNRIGCKWRKWNFQNW